jgi:hypothetical protein
VSSCDIFPVDMCRLSFMRSILPGVTPKYFGSEWSFAQVSQDLAIDLCGIHRSRPRDRGSRVDIMR